ncbi:MAG TPA: hypothetical protein VM427_06910 [Patescibacteria group bacterium]|nr:hypothetical protein [Patescibacteria group bacterium]
MTLIVALACHDAVVMAADSQATEMQGGANIGTAVRHGTQKIHTLGSHVLWAASGSVGIIQDVADVLDAWAAANPAQVTQPAKRMKPELIKRVVPVVREGYANWTEVPGMQNMPPLTSFLFAGHTGGYRWLLEISENTGGEFKENNGFASLGSAFNLAAVAAAMVSEYAAPSRELVEGTLLAIRVLETAVQAAAFGVGGDTMLAVATKDGARIYDPSEVREVQDRVATWRQLETETLAEVIGKPATALVADAAGAGGAVAEAAAAAPGPATARPDTVVPA